MSIAVACRRSLVLGQSADLYVLRYDNRPIVAISKPSLGHRDGGHLAGFYVIDTLHTITYYICIILIFTIHLFYAYLSIYTILNKYYTYHILYFYISTLTFILILYYTYIMYTILYYTILLYAILLYRLFIDLKRTWESCSSEV